MKPADSFRSLAFALFALAAALVGSTTAFADKDGGGVGDGGQGVFDLNSGQVRFVDILTADELAAMRLDRDPARAVFDRFPGCAKVALHHFSDRYESARQGAWKLIEKNERLLGNLYEDLRLAWHFNHRFVTALKLRQLKDATSIETGVQLQLASFKDGVAFFQEQALGLMPSADIEWLIIKEMLRYLARDKFAEVTNAEVEEAIRLIHQGDESGFQGSSFYKKTDDSALGPYERLRISAEASAREGGDRTSLALWLYQSTLEEGYFPAWVLEFAKDPQHYSKLRFSDPKTLGNALRPHGFFKQGFDVETGLEVRGKCSD